MRKAVLIVVCMTISCSPRVYLSPIPDESLFKSCIESAALGRSQDDDAEYVVQECRVSATAFAKTWRCMVADYNGGYPAPCSETGKPDYRKACEENACAVRVERMQ